MDQCELPKLTVKDIMIKEIVSVTPETPLIDAANLLVTNGFNGLPVRDSEKKLVGIITDYDLITKKAPAVHLPTFQMMLLNLPVERKDRGHFRKIVKEVASLTVEDAMNTEPLTLPDDASYEDVLKTFREHHRVNPIPVINKDRHVVGVVSRFDILKPLSSFRDA